MWGAIILFSSAVTAPCAVPVEGASGTASPPLETAGLSHSFGAVRMLTANPSPVSRVRAFSTGPSEAVETHPLDGFTFFSDRHISAHIICVGSGDIIRRSRGQRRIFARTPACRWPRQSQIESSLRGLLSGEVRWLMPMRRTMGIPMRIPTVRKSRMSVLAGPLKRFSASSPNFVRDTPKALNRIERLLFNIFRIQPAKVSQGYAVHLSDGVLEYLLKGFCAPFSAGVKINDKLSHEGFDRKAVPDEGRVVESGSVVHIEIFRAGVDIAHDIEGQARVNPWPLPSPQRRQSNMFNTLTMVGG